MSEVRFGLGVALAIALVGAAQGQPATGRQTPDQQANVLIAAAGAEGVFSNETGRESGIHIRHIASGLQCRFIPGRENHIVLAPAPTPRGDDVTCVGPAQTFQMTLWARRNPGGSPRRELDAQVAVLKREAPDARPLRVAGGLPAGIDPATRNQMPPNETAWLQATVGGEADYVRLSVAQIGPWTLGLRATGPIAGLADAVNQTGYAWIGRLLEVEQRPR